MSHRECTHISRISTNQTTPVDECVLFFLCWVQNQNSICAGMCVWCVYLFAHFAQNHKNTHIYSDTYHIYAMMFWIPLAANTYCKYSIVDRTHLMGRNALCPSGRIWASIQNKIYRLDRNLECVLCVLVFCKFTDFPNVLTHPHTSNGQPEWLRSVLKMELIKAMVGFIATVPNGVNSTACYPYLCVMVWQMLSAHQQYIILQTANCFFFLQIYVHCI